MRAPLGSLGYWNKWVDFCSETIEEFAQLASLPPGNPSYHPQFVSEIAQEHYEQMLRKYSRGDAVGSLAQHFEGFLHFKEESERLGLTVWSEETQYTRNAWKVNLDQYIVCFWLVGLALTLEIPDAQWKRLLALMDRDVQQDALLDRVIATREPSRRIGSELCFPKVYAPLLAAIDAPAEQRAKRLRGFLEKWYPSLENAGHPSFPRDDRTPYWYTFGDENFEGGAYFGRWCIEAAAVAKAFGIDDSLCLDHPHYPGDLVCDGRSPRYPDALPVGGEGLGGKAPGWLARLFGVRQK